MQPFHNAPKAATPLASAAAAAAAATCDSHRSIAYHHSATKPCEPSKERVLQRFPRARGPAGAPATARTGARGGQGRGALRRFGLGVRGGAQGHS